MKKLKLYIDTSVISHLFADDTLEKMFDTNEFWSDLISDKYTIFISSTTAEELLLCAEPKRTMMINKLKEIKFETLTETCEIKELAFEYLKNNVLTQKSFDDCMHIAFAVVNNCDAIISWNFKHLVNFKTINKVKIVNAMNNYREIIIVSPTMMLEEV